MLNIGIADISRFMSLCNLADPYSMCVFNEPPVNLDSDIKPKIEEWMRLIDKLRSLDAQTEADAEQDKMEGYIRDMMTKVDTAIDAVHTTLSRVRTDGPEENTENPVAPEDDQQMDFDMSDEEGGAPPEANVPTSPFEDETNTGAPAATSGGFSF